VIDLSDHYFEKLESPTENNIITFYQKKIIQTRFVCFIVGVEISVGVGVGISVSIGI